MPGPKRLVLGVGSFQGDSSILGHYPVPSAGENALLLSSSPQPKWESSIPQRFPRLQCVLNPLLRLLLTAQRFEALALQIKNVLLAHRRSRGDVAAAEDFGDL